MNHSSTVAPASGLPDASLEPLRSVHTLNFPGLLRQLGISLVISTYQAGKVVLARADGDSLNTHFRPFHKPMGLAFDQGRLAIGTSAHIWELRNIPAVAPKVPPIDRHDACFMPRHMHTTGDIDIHEMAWGKDHLWFVNTRFSCLCTRDADYSFVPRWRPPFVTGYAPEDRCHLNGLAMVNGQPKYVTALGTTNTAQGWRDHKASGGIVMDIETNDMLVEGLSMPHSPRWYRDQLWVLESGHGTLAKVDLATGTREPVVELPGFTRGLDFYGPLAFIGLSQVRESAVFSGIPLVERLTERTCGVWVVNIETGEVLAFLKFEDAVTEIFALQVLPGIQFPELIHEETDLLKSAYVLPDEALAQVQISETPVPEAEQYLHQGKAAYEAGHLSEAAEHYRQGLALSPQNMTARYSLGIILVDLGEWQAGIDQLNQVVAERPDHAEAHNSLGVAYLKLQQQDLARWHFERAVKLRPGFAIASNNLQVLTAAEARA